MPVALLLSSTKRENSSRHCSAFLALAGAAGGYSFLLFLPIIFRRALGYSMQLSLILTAPPAAFATLYTFSLSWASDKLRLRGHFVVLHCLVAIVGLCMIAFPSSGPTRYAGAFLGQAGGNAILVSVNAWGMNNIRTDAERSVYSAWATGTSAIGGIYSALVFRQQVRRLTAAANDALSHLVYVVTLTDSVQDSPNYIPGVVAVGAMTLFTLVLTVITLLWMYWCNRQADRGKRVIEGSASVRYIL